MFVPKEMKRGGYGNGRRPGGSYRYGNIRHKPPKRPVRIPWMWIIILAPLALGIFSLLTM
jgi:hypothetical protein